MSYYSYTSNFGADRVTSANGLSSVVSSSLGNVVVNTAAPVAQSVVTQASNVYQTTGAYDASYLSSAASSNAAVNQIAQDILTLNAGAAAQPVIESSFEQAILRAANPIDVKETEVVTVNGETGLYANRAEVVNWRGVVPINQYVINEDPAPEVIRKRTDQQIIYDQEVAVRYLRPPTPPPPGEILIRQEKNIPTPPAPPLVIRQQPPRPETPPPLVVREAPPRPPAAIGPKLITISGKRLPPPPRKVIIERLPPLPSKPQSVIIERWLPYAEQKRRVIFARNTEPDPVIPRPRNVVIQWDAPQVVIKKELRDLGVVRANPAEYVSRYGATLKSHIELPEFVKDIRPPAGIVLAAEYVPPPVCELEGDVQALNFIDLDREGLSEYRSWYGRGWAPATTVTTTTVTAAPAVQVLNSCIGELFNAIDVNSDSRISLSEAERLLMLFNQRLGRRYNRDDALVFMRHFDLNRDGFIDFPEFRRAILTQF